MAKGILRKIYKARERVSEEIRGHAQRSAIAGALSSEGYSGGYRDALDDIINLLNGIIPNRRNYYD